MIQKFFFNSFDDKKICWRKLETGHQTGRALVLLHGLGQDYFHYMNLFANDPEYKSWFDTIYAIEFRGHGESYKKYDDRVHFGDFSDVENDTRIWLETIVSSDSVGKELFLFGHSFGGSVAISILAKKPNLFKKAILSSPCIFPKLAPIELFDFQYFVKKKIPTPHLFARIMEIPVRILKLEEEPIANKIIWKSLLNWDVPYHKTTGSTKYDIRDKIAYESSLNHYTSVNLKKSCMYGTTNKVGIFLLNSRKICSEYSKKIKTETICFVSEYDYFVYSDYTINLFKTNKNIKTFVIEGCESHNVFLDSEKSSSQLRTLMRDFI